jgi:hypothetical protein
MHSRNDLAPEVRILASEVFNRCWQFLENDPALAGENLDNIQERLAALVLLQVGSGERSLLAVANKAIGTLRLQYASQCDRPAVEVAAQSALSHEHQLAT